MPVDQEIFDRNLMLTQVYCATQLAESTKPHSEILRSINPEYDGKPMVHFLDGDFTYVNFFTDPLSSNLYGEFFEAQLKYKNDVIQGAQTIVPGQGKILLIDIYEALPDGASELATKGFIDRNDCPPIDTWFYMDKSKHWPVLFAWIPEQFVEIVDEGIAVNALEIFDWLEDPKGVLNTRRFSSNQFVGRRPFAEVPFIDQDAFNQNLLLTQAYCEMQLENDDRSPAEVLRSFNPVFDNKALYKFVPRVYSHKSLYQSAQWSVSPLGRESDDLYTNLFEQQLVNKKEKIKAYDNNLTYKGQILIVYIDDVIPDGVSDIETRGFIDENECPPIDTWFYIATDGTTRILYAWIPQRFIEVVDHGIDVNALNFFNWRDRTRYHAYFTQTALQPNSAHNHWLFRKLMPLDVIFFVVLLISIIVWLAFGR